MKKPSLTAAVLALAILAPVSQLHAETAAPALINGYQPTWWKEAVVYQVYPRSFKDSNGDGIGDIPGITSKLDYLQKLGVNVIWLSPHYDSPNADNGYDIRDYRKVMSEFGTMADFDKMLAGIKQRHMRLIVDLVVNHTSDEHHWFVESRKSKDNPYRDYYFWRDGKPDPAGKPGPDGKPTTLPPNNDPSFFSGSAWQFDPTTSQYYLHYFAVKQPDLNWDNPKVREEVYSLMRFWLDKGVDGFRMDVIPLISKNPAFPDLTPDQLHNYGNAYANGPHMHEYLQEMNRNVMAKYDVMTVGEALGISLEQTPLIVGDDRHELNMIFNFDAIRSNRVGYDFKPADLPTLKAIYTRHAEVLDTHSWDTVFLSNHDNPRIVSTFGDDSPEFRVPSAKLLETMILTLRGTPFLYQGDELGMTNYPFKSITDFDDIEVKNAYKANVVTGKIPEDVFIANLRHTSRDNSRTPVQWDSSTNGGFTTAAKPWLAANPNYTQINAAAEVADPNSIYNYTAKLIALRHAHQAFVYGDYKDIDPDNKSIFAYTRTLGTERFLVVLNFSKDPITYALPGGRSVGSLVLSNLTPPEQNTATLHLAGWEARIYKLQ
ncbi:glycoside hydrolase family 13 protein [Tunturiibacter lichenicola]|uniref:glycoside hydrolase family 13 protein n=1 Tax=Tunturiibacter lichenicola TaxID=2051959 RepID=UPI0021B3EC8B|nr:alpha-glucosidase [Edaphobacter lichenicola]